MFFLDAASWFFYAAEEDGQLPIIFGAMIEATLAVIVAVVIHRLTDTRDLERRLSRTEEAMAGAIVSHQAIEQRLDALEADSE